MESVIAAIEALCGQVLTLTPDRIEKLPQSGSDRIYFRVYAGAQTYIATYNINTKETETFVYFSKHFKQANLPVPAILGVNETNTIYLQEDLGTDSLLNKLEANGHGDYSYQLFQQSLASNLTHD